MSSLVGSPASKGSLLGLVGSLYDFDVLVRRWPNTRAVCSDWRCLSLAHLAVKGGGVPIGSVGLRSFESTKTAHAITEACHSRTMVDKQDLPQAETIACSHRVIVWCTAICQRRSGYQLLRQS